MRPVTANTYNVLIELVKGCFKKQVRERSRLENNATVLFWRNKNKLSVSRHHGRDVLLYDRKKVAVQDKLQSMVEKSRKEMKGGGARSVAHVMKGKYERVSERRIRDLLNKSKGHGELQAKFTNKPPMKFISANRVFGRVQIDLVCMPAVQSQSKLFKYIITIVDMFSCFLFCRPLQNKSTEHVAKSLKEIFEEHGWPEVIQCDNGPEFVGEVNKLFRRKKVKVIKGRPYHPQSQGKVERQNRIIRKKIRHEIGRRGHSGFNWVEKLNEIQSSINHQPKEVLGYQTPLSVYFGRGKKKSADEVRKNAREASEKCNQRTFASRMRKIECSVYERGAKVLVRYPLVKECLTRDTF